VQNGLSAKADTSAVATALSAYAPLASPTFTGTPLAPTAAPGTNNGQVASTAFVSAAIAAAPGGATVTQGTFTPVVVGTGFTGAGTYTSQVGNYLVIGNLVYFRISIGWSAHTGTADLRIINLPFIPASARTPVSIETNGLTIGAGKLLTAGVLNTSVVELFLTDQSTGVMSNCPIDSSVTFITVSGCYIKS
jgi:hypothetical protein